MRRLLPLFAGLACAVATIAPAAAYEIDPLTRQPIVAAEGLVPQATAIPREIVPFEGRYKAGTVVVSTTERRLYYVLGDGTAIRYGVGVGRPGFDW
jgi:lipoprotein-anchoring transpeptidase ErfK/SrfK